MTDNATDLDVVIDPPASAEGDPPAQPKTDKPVVEPEVGMEALKAQLAEARAATATAERERDNAQARERAHADTATKALTDKHQADIDKVSNALEVVKGNAAVLEQRYAEALSLNDYAAAAKINTEIGTNSAKLIQLESGLQILKDTPAPKPPAPAGAPSYVEQLAGQVSPEAARWLRAHPDAVRDETAYARLVSAHNLISTTPGVVLDSPEYFAGIETLLGIREAKLPGEEPLEPDPASAAAAPVARRQAPPPAAPANRGNSGARQVIRLTAEEREAAALNGLTDEEYATNKAELIKQGRMN